MQWNTVAKVSQKLGLPPGLLLFASSLLLVALVAAFHNGKFQRVVVLEESIPTEIVLQGSVLPASLPVRLRIPALTIDAGFVEPLGLLPNGEAEVPESNTAVGWYKYGPTPGEFGPAVIFGHVDSYTGPAIFFSLGQLKPGDDVLITREDGTEAHFVVTKLERYPQAAFPTAEVYGDIDHAGLRLVTCTGVYVRGTARYTHNLVVYAKLVE